MKVIISKKEVFLNNVSQKALYTVIVDKTEETRKALKLSSVSGLYREHLYNLTLDDLIALRNHLGFYLDQEKD
jgi:hypothetical protein